MRKYAAEFVKRGLMSASGGPVILAIIYGLLGKAGVIDTLTPREVCIGILSMALMAFVAAGITMVYQVEHLPLISAVLIHGGVLYADYLLIYMLNSWIPRNWEAIGCFTVIFGSGYAVTWAVIYLCIRRRTERINKMLQSQK